MPDAWQIAHFGHLGVNPNADPDHDGLTNRQEYEYGTDPNNPDTDGDGMPDGWEVHNWLDPLRDDSAEDLDGDGFTNLQEYQRGTDPWDYYNGKVPVVTSLIGANGSLGADGCFSVQVTGPDGRPVPNAPVTLTIEQGGSLFSLAPHGADGLTSAVVYTDANGIASVYVQSQELSLSSTSAAETFRIDAGNRTTRQDFVPPHPAVTSVVFSEASTRTFRKYGWGDFTRPPGPTHIYMQDNGTFSGPGGNVESAGTMVYDTDGNMTKYGGDPWGLEAEVAQNDAIPKSAWSVVALSPTCQQTTVQLGDVGTDVITDTISKEYPTEILLGKADQAEFPFTGNLTNTYQYAQRNLSASEITLEVTKLKYKIKVLPGYTGSVSWQEIYVPDDSGQRSDVINMTEVIAPGISETKVHMIDPLGRDSADSNASHRHPRQNGSYYVVMAGLAVDANRDGQIELGAASSDATSATQPFRFWINDDDDAGDGMADANDTVVNGVNDLKDFFPVYLDLKQLLNVLPPSTPGVKYILKQHDNALNFVYTNLTRATAFSYQDGTLATGFGPVLGQPAASARTQTVTATGVDIFAGSPAFLDAIQSHDGGVLLIEGRLLTDQPLVLSVEKTGGTVIAEIKLELVGIRGGTLWETSNKANQIFNPTKKDDSTDPGLRTTFGDPVLEVEGNGDATYAVPRNNLYIVADPSDNKLKVSLDLGIPATSRTKFIAAAWDGITKVAGSDAAFPADSSQPANLQIAASAAAETKEYQIRVGLDANGNGLLDANEASAIEIYRRKDNGRFCFATVKGISNAKYEANKGSIKGDADGIIVKTLVPHAHALLSRFVYGDFSHADINYQPADSDISTVSLDPFHNSTATDSDYCEWLTHNCGAHFQDAGAASDLELVKWPKDSRFSIWIASNVNPFALNTLFEVLVPGDPPQTVVTQVPTPTGDALKAFYNTTVKSLALADLTPKADGEVFISDWYNFPQQGSSLFASLNPNGHWPQSTVLLGTQYTYSEAQVPGSIAAVVAQFGGNTTAVTNYDGFITGGRVRVNIQYQFQIQRKNKLFGGFDLTVLRLLSRGTVEDLYDFNFEDGGIDSLSQKAATIQIGSGNGTGPRVMPGRGHIFRVRWEIDSVYTNPF
jgi:hypothetical protein